MALDPDYLKKVGDKLGDMYEDVETEILQDIARRIKKNGGQMTAASVYEATRLKEFGLTERQIEKKLAELTNRSQSEVQQLMRESTNKAMQDDLNIYHKAKVNTDHLSFKTNLTKSTRALNKDLKNLTGTTAKSASMKFLHLLDKAYLLASSGAYTDEQSVKMVVKELAKQGIDSVQYGNTKTSLDSAVRRAVRTAVSQNALACQMDAMDELGVNLIETSSHLGARPTHAVWQGKVFWRNTPVKGYENFYEATGYGTGGGLGGWNCRHSFYPYYEEIDEQTYQHYDETLNSQYYEIEQKQRYYERQCRKWDRQRKILQAGGVEHIYENRKYNEWKSKLDDLQEQTDGWIARRYASEYNYDVVNPKAPVPLDLQLFTKKIKPLKLSAYEMATVPSALRVFARAQPKDEMYPGRRMVKEYGDYRYFFIWYSNDNIVVYKRRKIRGRVRS